MIGCHEQHFRCCWVLSSLESTYVGLTCVPPVGSCSRGHVIKLSMTTTVSKNFWNDGFVWLSSFDFGRVVTCTCEQQLPRLCRTWINAGRVTQTLADYATACHETDTIQKELRNGSLLISTRDMARRAPSHAWLTACKEVERCRLYICDHRDLLTRWC